MILYSNSDKELLTKKASFIQHSLPGMAPGRYDLKVYQTLLEKDGTDITGALPEVSKKIGVQGLRYSLDPGMIHSTFPPKDSSGEFSNSLPHVVFNNEKLPWLRTPYDPMGEPPMQTREYKTIVDGHEEIIHYDDDKSTWMTVLLISPDDLGGENPSSRILEGSMQDLVDAKQQIFNSEGPAVQGKMAGQGYSQFSYFFEKGYDKATTIDPGIGFNYKTPCRYIDIPCSLLDNISPSVEDLELTAHIRVVKVDHKQIGANQLVDEITPYSLVMGNRLPESLPSEPAEPTPTQPAKGKNVAVLVSLEHMRFALRGHAADTYYQQQIASKPGGFVRLVVLHTWEFTSWQDSSFEFEHILKSINKRDPASDTTPVPNPLFRIPDTPTVDSTPEEKVVKDMLELGYFPMNHITRVAGSTENTPVQLVSWYRGPLIPFPKKENELSFIKGDQPDTQHPMVFSADKLLRFDPKIGVYDVSYAAAWQLGRLLSLQSKNFSVPLYIWKKQIALKYRMLLEDCVLKEQYSELIKLYEEMNADKKVPASDKAIYRSILQYIMK